MTETNRLSGQELVDLVRRVFAPGAGDRALGVMMDLPDGGDGAVSQTPGAVGDDEAWAARRAIAAEWAAALHDQRDALGIETRLVLYANVHTNNGDLPGSAWVLEPGGAAPGLADLDASSAVGMEEILKGHQLFMAITKFSSTAPLKVAAKKYGFRAATMPGFGEAMIPALRLDYLEVGRRVGMLKEMLDRAVMADILFGHPAGESRLKLDLRHRGGHASSGLLHAPGEAGNLPSGEAYIVPYEGEIVGDASRSEGELPVQFGGEVVLYGIRANKAVAVLSKGPASDREAALIAREPAYANLAELGLGVLAPFGVKPIGAVLLDEKLGLHIAFGRSDHFGGAVGPGDFTSPEAVVHIDRVYVPELQPDVRPLRLTLVQADGTEAAVMADGDYVIPFPKGAEC